MLKSLEIAGFKSFAKKTELQFKSKITAIVGPNGSGKSNVAEAFRFALGEQSMKSMRGKRGEDLIWNGSTEVSRANRANVKLVFDNPNSNNPESKNTFSLNDQKIDFNELMLERVVNRDGSNEYYLNGSLVRLKDILELLSQVHIGASHHHIISQGEADRILSANNKERREMIQDALGLKVYEYKREESERKLLKTAENIKQVESLRREIAPHLKFLKKQVEKVEKAEELKNRLVDFYKTYLKKEQLFIENQKTNLHKERAPLEQSLVKLNELMEKAKAVLSTSSNKDATSQELLDIETQIKNERETQDRLYREIGKIEGEINANQKTIEKILTDQKSEETKMIPLREVEELERELNGLNEIVAIIDRIKNFILSHKNKIDDRHLVNLQNTNEDLNQQRSVLENQISEAETKSHELANQYQQIKERIEKEKDSSREAEKEIFKISSEQSEIHNKLKILEIETKRIVHLEEEWKREIQEGGVLLGTAILGFENLPLTINDPDFNQNYESGRDEIRKELEKMKIRLEELGGAGGSEVMKEYQETLERDEYLNRELEDLKKSAESLEILIQDLVNRLDIEFREGIEKINKIFKDFFALMFGGGTAELVLEKIKTKNSKFIEEGFESTNIPSELLSNEKETVEEGIEIAVSLPRKRIKGLEMLSGGERALTSIALLFAISQVNPPPFIILDETDAALDEANSKKYGDMIESLSKYSQLILITHNRETMSRAGIIYGVTMGRDGVSRLLSIAFDEAVAVAK